MVVGFVAHVADTLAREADSWQVWVLASVAAAALLAVEHLLVDGGVPRLRRAARTACASAVILGLTGGVSAPAGAAQFPEPLAGLPDLISDPPFLWFVKDVVNPDGELLHVLAFDGMLHNVGEGMLDVSGNPQVPGDVQQRVFNGTTWEPVGTPTVRYETNDGHNHFHLIAAVEYALWDEARVEEIVPASKVGFCLVDTQQIEEIIDAFYSIERFDYCGVDDPDTTDLRMGISPGWIDVYDASTTLQWVDVSDTPPGRYWVSAITDPNDEIVESDELNNGLVFSMNKYAVPGYQARALQAAEPGEIVLKADAYGVVGDRAFVIAEGPAHGTLDVPVGVDLFDPFVSYEPEPGFVGTDSFTYYAHDVESMFPHAPEPSTVTVTVDGAAGGPLELAPLEGEITTDAPLGHRQYEPLSASFSFDGEGADEIVWYAAGLPPGLRIDATSGQVVGVPTTAGAFESTIVARHGHREVRSAVSWEIEGSVLPSLRPFSALSTSRLDELRVSIGLGGPDRTYETTGMPAGTAVLERFPLITGTPEEAGTFDVVVTERQDGVVTATIEFTWTVRPGPIPAFVV